MPAQFTNVWDLYGEKPPKPFDEKTPEERKRDKDRFLAILNETHIDDETVDEFFRAARMNPVLQIPDLTDAEEETA